MNSKLSPGKQHMLGNMLETIALRMFDSHEHQQYWVTLLSVESRFDQRAKSPVGAIGIGQLMPQYRNSFAKLCNVPELKESDLQDTYTNAYISACLFKELIKNAGGSVPLALAAYNAGPNSYGYRQAQKGEAPAQETANYIAKIVLRKEGTK